MNNKTKILHVFSIFFESLWPFNFLEVVFQERPTQIFTNLRKKGILVVVSSECNYSNHYISTKKSGYIN